jgi:hypothetical protein
VPLLGASAALIVPVADGLQPCALPWRTPFSLLERIGGHVRDRISRVDVTGQAGQAPRPWEPLTHGEAVPWETVYEHLRSRADLDAVHELVAKYGTAVLERGVPYVLVAARNRLRSDARRASATREVAVGNVESAVDPPNPLLDPFERVSRRPALRAVLAAMSQMDPADALIVWRTSEGVPDVEIVEEWNELGYEPTHPSAEYIRKRRERARQALRKRVLAELNEHS